MFILGICASPFDRTMDTNETSDNMLNNDTVKENQDVSVLAMSHIMYKIGK